MCELLCKYGCGKPAINVLKNGNKICGKSSSSCPVNKEKQSKILKEVYSSGKRQCPKQQYKNLSPETKELMVPNKGKRFADFSINGKGNHKAVLLIERGHKCESCCLEIWLNEPIPLELEHSDGNNKNNNKENLKLLCPNCHAKTPFYRGRNINRGKTKVTNEDILAEIRKGISIRQVLINVGLTPKGGNYDRVKKIMATYPSG